MTDPEHGATTMTAPEILKIAAIKAILEAIEEGDEDDAKQALRLIRGMIGAGEKTAEK